MAVWPGETVGVSHGLEHEDTGMMLNFEVVSGERGG